MKLASVKNDIKVTLVFDRKELLTVSEALDSFANVQSNSTARKMFEHIELILHDNLIC